MGNFHCVPEGCAEVRYQPYEKSGGIRYRYGNEDWQVVDGDNYKIDDKRKGQCEDVLYLLVYTYIALPRLAVPYPGVTLTKRISVGRRTVVNPIVDKEFEPKAGEEVITRDGIKFVYNDRLIAFYYRVRTPDGIESKRRVNVSALPGSLEVDIIRLDGEPDDCGDCSLTISKNGQTVLEITRDDCPKVEKISDDSDDGVNCQLSDRTHAIKVEKSPYLERVEVRNQSIETIYISPLEAPLIDTKPLPENCLNIYQTYVAAPPILSNYVPLPGAINPYQFIAQICSAEGCPAPKYEVICSCGEECPDGTCPVFCGNHVCCHDSTGNAVHQIPIEDYAGDLS